MGVVHPLPSEKHFENWRQEKVVLALHLYECIFAFTLPVLCQPQLIRQSLELPASFKSHNTTFFTYTDPFGITDYGREMNAKHFRSACVHRNQIPITLPCLSFSPHLILPTAYDKAGYSFKGTEEGENVVITVEPKPEKWTEEGFTSHK